MLKSNKPSVGIDRLKSILDYNVSTGLFTWKIYANRRARIGGKAGCPCPLGYIKIKIDKRLYPAHRLAWFYCNEEWPNGEIDHINGKREDNRIENLRIATRSQNCGNANGKGGVTGFKGVTIQQGRFKACIMKDGVKKFLGYFDSPEVAARAYDTTALEIFGEFAKTNF